MTSNYLRQYMLSQIFDVIQSEGALNDQMH